MTLHLRTPEYTCENCNTTFIAYSNGLKCPKCAQPEESQGEAYDFVDEQVRAMICHKKQYGRFTPGAWHTGCYADQLQILLFQIFDRLYKDPSANLIKESSGVKLHDGNNESFLNDQYLNDLCVSIFEKLDVRLKKYEEEQEILAKKKEDRKIINRLKRFLRIK